MRAGLRYTVLAVMGLMGCGLCLGAEPPAYPSATPVKHNSLKVCNQQADARKLSGAARTQFVKHCQTQTVSAHAPATATGSPAQAAR
jgi:psiF repeat